MTRKHRPILPGSPNRLGAHWDGKGVNFAVYSEHADKVELCLFDETGTREIERIPLMANSCGIRHSYVPGLAPGQIYGYRAHGEFAPEKGKRFNPEKLLLDPYAREIVGGLDMNEQHRGHDSRKPHLPDSRDNAAAALKARVTHDNFDWEGVSPPKTPWRDTVVYELHVKGFTQQMPQIPDNLRGTFSGLCHPESLRHLKALGVTAVELMPVHAFVHDQRLVAMGLKNFWGYNTVGFFAPHPEYLAADGKDSAGAPQGHIHQFKNMVKEFHKAGIEVILDVVFNHTAEGDHLGPTLSLRGLDNESYYRLDASDRRHYIDDTGCGNTLDASKPAVQKLVIDCLRYWAEECRVDGFRFDLATSLGRDDDGFNRHAPLLEMIKRDPVLSRKKLIAEPWDIGPGGYQLGNFPTGWREWNDRFRDEVRRFWRGDAGAMGDKAHRLSGSAREFDRNARSPGESLNFITAHDGFTLEDLVSYDHKHNLDNGEQNRDGHNHNFSHNHGVEGKTDNPEILSLRDRKKRNMLASLLLAQGTPMLLAGDEFSNSQNGNNNAYCQDNPTGWIDWSGPAQKRKNLTGFIRNLLCLRKRHPAITHPEFLHGKTSCADGVRDIVWYAPDGHEKRQHHWHDHNNRTLAVLFNSAAIKEKPNAAPRATAPAKPDSEPDLEVRARTPDKLLVIFNAANRTVPFTLPRVAGVTAWRLALDTAQPEMGPDDDQVASLPGRVYPVPAKSVVVFEKRLDKPGQKP